MPAATSHVKSRNLSSPCLFQDRNDLNLNRVNDAMLESNKKNKYSNWSELEYVMFSNYHHYAIETSFIKDVDLA